MYIYQKTEPGIWSVGMFTSSGKWEPESDWNTAAEAMEHAHILNEKQEATGKPDHNETTKTFGPARK